MDSRLICQLQIWSRNEVIYLSLRNSSKYAKIVSSLLVIKLTNLWNLILLLCCGFKWQYTYTYYVCILIETTVSSMLRKNVDVDYMGYYAGFNNTLRAIVVLSTCRWQHWSDPYWYYPPLPNNKVEHLS